VGQSLLNVHAAAAQALLLTVPAHKTPSNTSIALLSGESVVVPNGPGEHPVVAD
jgi:hypothetical protein